MWKAPVWRSVSTCSFRRIKRNSGSYPASLACAQQKCFLNTQCVHRLPDHDGAVPVGEVLGRSSSSITMAERLDSNQVQQLTELRVLKLRAIELAGRQKRVNHNQSGLVLAEGLCQPVRHVYASQMGHIDGLWHPGVYRRRSTFRHGSVWRVRVCFGVVVSAQCNDRWSTRLEAAAILIGGAKQHETGEAEKKLG